MNVTTSVAGVTKAEIIPEYTQTEFPSLCCVVLGLCRYRVRNNLRVKIIRGQPRILKQGLNNNIFEYYFSKTKITEEIIIIFS